MTDDPGKLRERIAILETSRDHMAEQIDTMAKQLAEVHEVLLQAKGARWMLISLAVVIGFVVGNLKPLAQWLGVIK